MSLLYKTIYAEGTVKDEESNKKHSSQARLKAKKYWDSRIIAKKYIDAYRSALSIY